MCLKCGVCPHLTYVSHIVLHLCACPFMQEMSFKGPRLFLFKCECSAEKNVCLYKYLFSRKQFERVLIAVIEFICLQRLATVPSNGAFEERANFGVFLWMVFTMILCSVIVLPLILVCFQFFTI